MKILVAVKTFIILLAVVIGGSRSVEAQVGPQLIITVNFADRVRPAGGSYYIAFTIDDTILLGPQSDSSFWTHYVLFRGGRFFFGRVPSTPFRPFGFEAIRPPEPYLFGQVLPDGRTIRVRVPLSALQVGIALPTQVKVNFVTVDELLRPVDALGQGAADRFAFVTLDLRKDTYVAITDPVRDAPDPAFDITGGDIQVTTP